MFLFFRMLICHSLWTGLVLFLRFTVDISQQHIPGLFGSQSLNLNPTVKRNSKLPTHILQLEIKLSVSPTNSIIIQRLPRLLIHIQFPQRLNSPTCRILRNLMMEH